MKLLRRKPVYGTPVLELPGGETIVLHMRKNPRARSLILRLLPYGEGLDLVLPRWISKSEGLEFALSKLAWIQRELGKTPARVVFAHGVEIPFLDEVLTIRHEAGGRGVVWREENALCVAGKPEHLPRRVNDWLKKEARGMILPKAHGLAARLERDIKRISLRDSKSRWGSCSEEGRMAFSWRLVMAPQRVLDYVVAHEVAHLVELNHSKAFWAVVAGLAGDYREPRAWLGREGAKLHRFG